MATRVLILLSILVLAAASKHYGQDQQYPADGRKMLQYQRENSDSQMETDVSQLASGDSTLNNHDSQLNIELDGELDNNANSQVNGELDNIYDFKLDGELDNIDDFKLDGELDNIDDSKLDGELDNSNDSQLSNELHNNDSDQVDNDLENYGSQLNNEPDGELYSGDSHIDRNEVQVDSTSYLIASKSSPPKPIKKVAPGPSPSGLRKQKRGRSMKCAQKCRVSCSPEKNILPLNVAPPAIYPSCMRGCISQCNSEIRFVPSVRLVNGCTRTCAVSIIKRFINSKTKRRINRKTKRVAGAQSGRTNLVTGYVSICYKKCFDKNMKIRP